MPRTYTSTAKWFHWLIVLLIIAVMILRGLWRLTHRVPPLPRGTKRWEATAAHFMHFSLYLLLFIIPFAGWAWANASGVQVSAFWIFPMPNIVPAGWQYAWLAADGHVYLAVLLCCLIALHILAALWHWYAKRDGVLERMLPGTTEEKRELMGCFKSRMKITNGVVTTETTLQSQ